MRVAATMVASSALSRSPLKLMDSTGRVCPSKGTSRRRWAVWGGSEGIWGAL